MTIDVVVLAEEPSGRVIAECLAEKLGFADRVLCLGHQGKSDLDRSFPRKIGHWRADRLPRFIVMRDNDGLDCFMLKRRLLDRVPNDAIQRVKVRLVIHELESWYLGDLQAVVQAGLVSDAIVNRQKRKAKLRNPDRLNNAKQVFRELVSRGGQMALALGIGPHLSLTDNRSVSFRHFIGALRWAAG